MIEFSIVPGKKPDVNVQFREAERHRVRRPALVRQHAEGHHPVRRLQRPALPRRRRAEGIKAGFDLAIPDLAVGVFALDEHQLWARNFRRAVHRRVDRDVSSTSAPARTRSGSRCRSSPAAGSSASRSRPRDLRVLEAAFEFGAAIDVNLGVASGGVSIMAGIYFKLETDDDGDDRGDAHRLLPAAGRGRRARPHLARRSSCTWSSPTRPRPGRPSAGRRITIEVEVFFFSFSVSDQLREEVRRARTATRPSPT